MRMPFWSYGSTSTSGSIRPSTLSESSTNTDTNTTSAIRYNGAASVHPEHLPLLVFQDGSNTDDNVNSSHDCDDKGSAAKQQPKRQEPSSPSHCVRGPVAFTYRYIQTLWSNLTFQWLTPILYIGQTQNRLDFADLQQHVPLPRHCQTQHIYYDTFAPYWDNELLKHRQQRTEMESSSTSSHCCVSIAGAPSLVRALFRAFGYQFLCAGLYKFVNDVCLFIAPYVLMQMIHFLQTNSVSLWTGVGWTALLTVSQLCTSLCLRHYFFHCYQTGLQIRTALTMAIYAKALRMSSTEKQRRGGGEITTLLSVDTQRWQDLTTYLHSIWSSPLQIALCVVFLGRKIGWTSTGGGVAAMCLLIPMTKFVATWMGSIQRSLMKRRDERVTINNEVISGIKTIKYQGWEGAYHDRITALREEELSQLFRYCIATSMSRMLMVLAPLTVSLSTFAVYVWSGNTLTVATAFTSLAIFDILRFPLFILPQVINSIVEAMVAIHRIESFLLCDEYFPLLSATRSGRQELDGNCMRHGGGFQFQNVSAVYDARQHLNHRSSSSSRNQREWDMSILKSQLEDSERQIRELLVQQQQQQNKSDRPSSMAAKDTESTVVEDSIDCAESTSVDTGVRLCLRRVNFTCQPGELVAVVGEVGSGKSTLVNALLGEVPIVAGTTSVPAIHKVAVFSQTPFIMNATVRDNILFGSSGPIDELLYQRALTSCAMQHDLDMFPDGDHTEIGPRGITLSGGQKARISLARAVYHQADLTLIDDALAAVDAHVAQHLFQQAIVGELLSTVDTTVVASGKHNKRSVVLVTNAIHFLKHPRVNRIVVMNNGRVIEEGTYMQLMSSKRSVFAKTLSTMAPVSHNIVDERSDTTLSLRESNHVGLANGTTPVDTQTVKHSEHVIDIPSIKEERQMGQIKLDVYVAWTKAAGGGVRWAAPIAILTAFLLFESASVTSNWWLTYWSQHADEHSQVRLLKVYAWISLSAAIANIFRMLVVTLLGLQASRKLFSGMLSAVLNAKMSFFDTTAAGLLTNHFSKDVSTIDEPLTNNMRMYLITIFSVLSSVVVITVVTPIFALFLLPLLLFYISEQRFFTLTYNELKRLDSISRSPIYGLMGETVDGLVDIRAYNAQASLSRRMVQLLDTQQHAYYLTCAAQSWLSIRLELIGTIIVTLACVCAIVEHATAGANEKFAGMAGLSISYALTVTGALNWSVRMASDLDANMVAVERIQQLSKLEKEGERREDLDGTLPHEWPEQGEIRFQDVKLRYRPELPLVLKGLDLRIPAGSKVGVVGRTGAGKSTLMGALLRISDVSDGRILIDGVDIRQVGLDKLRHGIAVIPQDPILFTGTLRSNLDPFRKFSEDDLHSVLEAVAFPVGNTDTRSLDERILEGGANLSVGQRQLLVIARALLQNCKIVILDEATAAIDSATDTIIQRVLRTQFAKSSCITVAHRLNTVIDNDFILVMDDGRAVEFDSPKALLQRKSLFRALVESAAANE